MFVLGRCAARVLAQEKCSETHSRRDQKFKFILLGQSTVCERAWYNSVLHSKKERIQKKERVVADHTRGRDAERQVCGVPPTREDEVGHAETT